MSKTNVRAICLTMLLSLMLLAACTPEKSEAEAAEPRQTERSSGVEGELASVDDIPGFDEIQIPEGKKIKVGYLAQNETIQFCIYMGDALRDQAKRFGDQIEVEMVDARGLAATQVSQAEDMVVKGVDVVVLHPIDQEASAPALDIIVNAGIPLVTVNTNTVNKEIANAYVGVDDKEAGILAVQLMSQALSGEGTINVIKGLLGDPANENRMIGLKEEMGNHPDISVGSAQAADWDRGKAMNLTEDWLTSGRDFDGIIAMNDEMAISAALALDSVGITDVKIIGVDALDEALELIKAGKMYGTVFQNADAQGRGALNVALAAALGMEIEKNYIIPYEAVTAENVENYINVNQ